MFADNFSCNKSSRFCFKSKTFLILFIFLFSIGSTKSFQDELKFFHITTEDGLSLNVITSILQDSRGFMWFGTYNGLNRYDGYSFKIFIPESNKPNSISSHSIHQVFEDSKGAIWIATNNGLNRYDWRKEKFFRYRYNAKDKSTISNNFIYTIFEDKEGTLWIGTGDGLNKYNRENDSFNTFIIHDNPYLSSLNSITSIQEDKEGNLWIGTWDGLKCTDKKGQIIKQFWSEENNLNSLSSNQITSLLIDREHNLWIGTNGGGLDKFDIKNSTFSHYKSEHDNSSTISSNFIEEIFLENGESLWIGTKSGLNKFNKNNNSFIRIFHDPFKPMSLINNDVLAIYKDRSGLIWVGTSEGISKFFLPKNNFNYYHENKLQSAGSLSNNRVNSVFIDRDDNIWAGTREGLNKIVKSRSTVKKYHYDSDIKNSLSNNYVKSVYEDRTGMIWIGTDGGGLNRLNPHTDEFKLYKYTPGNDKSLSNDGVPVIYEDSNGILWIGTYYGLSRYNRKTDNFDRFLPEQNNSNSLRNGIVWVIFEDSEGILWIGTDGGGVSEFNPGTNSFKHHLYDSVSNSGSRVFSVFESGDKQIWIGTTEGLFNYDRKKGSYKHFTREDGLPSNAVNSIIEDNNGFLWLSSDKGLAKFDRKNNEFHIFTKRNGLHGNEFGINSSIKSDEGLLYFGTSDGLLFFNPDSITNEFSDIPVVFTDFKIYNQSVPVTDDGSSILNESITSVKKILKPYMNDVITIEFALLDYFNVKSNQFSYKLSGFESDWNNVGSRNSAIYTNLSPGEYIFTVRAFNNSGIKNVKETSLKIIIVPLFYQTWWFKTLFITAGVFIAFLIFKARTVKIENQNKLLARKVNERTKDLDETIKELSQEIVERKKIEAKVQSSLEEKEVLLKEIHHRVKNNLQVISSLLYLNSKKIKDKEALEMFKDSQNRVKSIALVHERLYQSNNLGKIDLKEYVQRLTSDLFRSYAIDHSVVKLEININEIFINIDTAVSCGLIINELISNSLKYAFTSDKEDPLIKIDITENDLQEILLIVSDNGVGIEGGLEAINSRKKSSLGLQLVDTLVAQMEGTLEADLTSGTLFRIKFKYNAC